MRLNYDKKAETKKNFPTLHKKRTEWEHSLNTEQNYQPKIIDAFQAVQTDLGHHIIPSIPCRVGWIGCRSTGKSSLVNSVRGLRAVGEYSQDRSTESNQIISPVRQGRSTYCQLEFEHEYGNGQKQIFVDIEGATDTDGCLHLANYFDAIIKGDCDVYLIVLDNYFTDIQRGWYTFIVEVLKRKCLLVRNKVDEVFRNMFKESTHQDFHLADQTMKNRYSKTVFEEVRREISHDLKGKTLPDLYLTFTSPDENLHTTLYPLSDMKKLINDLQNLSLNLHKMAYDAIAQDVNTCFRRGFGVNNV